MFRKESYVGTDPMVLEKAVHHYYSGSALVQEFSEDLPGEEHELEIEFDYLRGADGRVVRHRNPDEAEPDRLHFNDPQGTILEQGRPERPDGSPESYVMSAEGEPMQTTGMDNPSNIRFHGGYLEGKEFNADADTDRGHLYRMGIRHYSPALGRFLQREPLVNFRTPSRMRPLGLNPYIYGYNQPTEFADPSGYQSCGGCGSGKIGLGEGEKQTNNDGESDINCKTSFSSGSWCERCLGCCEYWEKPGEHPDRCIVSESICFSEPKDPDDNCLCDCIDNLSGGKHHPGTCNSSVAGPKSNGPYGPPELGPWGDGQAPIPVFPNKPFHPNFPLPFDPKGTPVMYFVKMYYADMGLSNINVSPVPGVSPKFTCTGAIAYGAAQALQTGVCFVLKKHCELPSELDHCLCEACNAWSACLKASSTAWFFFALGTSLIGFFAGGAFIPIFSLLTGFGGIMTATICTVVGLAIQECYDRYGEGPSRWESIGIH